jgi:hypothetical protein
MYFAIDFVLYKKTFTTSCFLAVLFFIPRTRLRTITDYSSQTMIWYRLLQEGHTNQSESRVAAYIFSATRQTLIRG